MEFWRPLSGKVRIPAEFHMKGYRAETRGNVDLPSGVRLYYDSGKCYIPKKTIFKVAIQ